jgi:AraC family transcriptional regulator
MVCQAIRRETRINDSVRPLAISGLVYQLIADLSREPAPGKENAAPWLRAVRERLETDYVRSPAVAELAAQAGVHPSYLLRAFVRHYGITIGAFLRRRRIEWAMVALRATGEPIAQIAQAAGFFDQSHFTRCFRQMVGMTPARFRSERADQGWSTGT